MNLQKLMKVTQEAWTLLKPAKKLAVSEWADTNRVLSSESSAEPGKWDTSRAEYQRDIMNAVNDVSIDTVVLMISSQSGKSEIILNLIGYYIDNDPGPMLLIQPTIEMTQAFSKERIAPMVRDTPTLKAKVADNKSRDSNNTIQMKLFPGGFLALGGANSPSGLASRPIRFLFADEIDRYPVSAGGEGDPLALAARRTQTFWNKKKIYVSTPTIKGASRIEHEYNKGTQERWCVLCTKCGTHQFLSMSGIKYEYSRDSRGAYSVHKVDYACSHCGHLAGEHEWKSLKGAWVAQNRDVKGVRSFHLNAFMSPWTTWESIIKEWLEAGEDAEKQRVVVNTLFGESYEIKGEIESTDELLSRREKYPIGTLPAGVLALTMGVDVQKDRLEFEIVGWGIGEECWGMKYGRILGSPDQPKVWQDLEAVLDTEFVHISGAKIHIACTFIDSGGHFTSDVYAFTRKNENRRVFSVKGLGGAGVALLHKLYRSKKENATVIIIGVDSGKATIISRLKIPNVGAGYCHFPESYDQMYFKGLISEKMVERSVKGQVKFVWEKVTERNEPFDIRNYAYAAMKSLEINFEKLAAKYEREEDAPVLQKPKKRRGVINKGV